MADRLFGIETEYALVLPTPDANGTEKEAVLRQMMGRVWTDCPCLPDLSSNGMFLANGSRVYVDAGAHPEATTPELANPWDAVRYILAADVILERLLAAAPNSANRPQPLLLKTNVDYTSGGAVTWGCHESIGYRTAGLGRLANELIPHLVSRVVYTGAGGFNPRSRGGIEFVLSPRALYLDKTVSGESTWNRAIVHDKDESLAGGDYHRLHLICGESVRSEIAMWLRSATTVLVVAMVDAGLSPGSDVQLDNAVASLHTVVGDPTCRTQVLLANGRRLTALEIQRHYLREAEQRVGADFMPSWTDTACRYWGAMLDQLDGAPDSVATTLDWAIKRSLFQRIIERRGFDAGTIGVWSRVFDALGTHLADEHGLDGFPTLEHLRHPPDSVRLAMRVVDRLFRMRRVSIDWSNAESFLQLRQELLECDARYSQLGSDGIFAALDRDGVLTHHVPGVDNVAHAIEHPPDIGRAKLRGDVIRRVQPQRDQFACTWSAIINRAENTRLDLSDPFQVEERWSSPPREAEDVARARRDRLRMMRDAPRLTREEPAFLRDAPAFLRGRHRLLREDPIEERPEEPNANTGYYNRRDDAFDCFVRGDYERARQWLESLLGDHFRPTGTHCHLVRVLLMQGRTEAARAGSALAWHHRSQAYPYEVGRTLWFLILFGLIDRDGSEQPWIGRLKTLMVNRVYSMEWTMEPVLASLAVRMPDNAYAIVHALHRVLDGSDLSSALDEHAWWREVEALPID